MKILYFGGAGASRSEDKIKILEKYGDEVVHVGMDYIREKNLIRNGIDVIRSFKEPVAIVGSSIGAYIAFYVSNSRRTPALLFNPSFNFKNGGQLRALENFDEYTKKIIVISQNDEVLNTKETTKYLNSLGYVDQIKSEDITHKIPVEIFEKYFDMFHENHLKSLKSDILDAKKAKSISIPKTDLYDWDDSLSKKSVSVGSITTEQLAEAAKLLSKRKSRQKTTIERNSDDLISLGGAETGEIHNI